MAGVRLRVAISFDCTSQRHRHEICGSPTLSRQQRHVAVVSSCAVVSLYFHRFTATTRGTPTHATYAASGAAECAVECQGCDHEGLAWKIIMV